MPRTPIQEVLDVIHNRVTVDRYRPGNPLTEDEIRALVADAIQAPSSFNIQHWRFVAVRSEEDKQRLMQAAYGQRQVADASVTFILLGDLLGMEKLPQILERAVADGAMPDRQASAWLETVRQVYAGDDRLARDEAIRSCSLAAMSMMLSAEARGLGTGALVGFDVERVRREFAIEERFLPVMLLTVGYPADRPVSRMPRLDVDEVLALDRARDF